MLKLTNSWSFSPSVLFVVFFCVTCSPSCLANGKSSSKWFSYYSLSIIMTSGPNTDHLICLCTCLRCWQPQAVLCHHPHPPLYIFLCPDRSCNPAPLSHPPNRHLPLSCVAIYVGFFVVLLLHPAWIFTVSTALYCTLILSADRWRRVFSKDLLMFSDGVPVLVEDGWRYYCCWQGKIIFILHVYCSHICSNYHFIISWIRVLTFSNHLLLWIVHPVSGTGPRGL